MSHESLHEKESEPFLRSREDYSIENEEPYARSSTNKGQSKRSSLLYCLSASVITSLIWGGILLYVINNRRMPHGEIPEIASTDLDTGQHSTLISGAKYITCGNSTAEAKTLKCEYDILSNHWVPAPCMDEESVKEYQSDGSWFGYAGEEATQRLSIDAMSDLPFYYTNMRDHIIHCAMLWRKQYRAFFQERRSLDSIIVDEEHTMHCSDFLIRMTEHGIDFSKIPIQVEVGYAGCHLRQEVC